MVFSRRTEAEARKLFNEGVTISVMTADRNPADSLASEICYTKGEELFHDSSGIASTFENIVQDFADWLCEDRSARNLPQPTDGQNKFTYWTCQLVRQ